MHHPFSAGLIIGGRSSREKLAGEKERILAMNIIVCTPGRLLQVCAVNHVMLSSVDAFRMQFVQDLYLKQQRFAKFSIGATFFYAVNWYGVAELLVNVDL